MNLRSQIEIFLSDRKGRDCNAETLKTYRSQLSLFVMWADGAGVVETKSITPDAISTYLNSLREREQMRRDGKLSPVTIHKRAKSLKTFLIWLARRELVCRDVLLSFPMPKRRLRLPKALTPRQIEILWSAEMSKRDRAIVCVMLDAGLRVSEVSGLVLDDLDFERGMIHIRHGKGDKERYALFSLVASEHLQAWLAERKSESRAVFVDEFGVPLKSGGAYKVVYRVSRSVGLKIHPHQLRHTFATEFLDAGGLITDLQKLLGHNDVNTTMIYSSVSLGSVRKRFASLSVVNRFGEKREEKNSRGERT